MTNAMPFSMNIRVNYRVLEYNNRNKKCLNRPQVDILIDCDLACVSDISLKFAIMWGNLYGEFTQYAEERAQYKRISRMSSIADR